MLVVPLNLCFLGQGDGDTKIGIAKSTGGGKFTESEQMKILSYIFASNKYNIQDNNILR